MSETRIVRDYPYPVITVWRALTDPELVPLWTSTGQGGRPEGFTAEPGTKFRLVGKPFPGWDGIVRCEVLAASAPTLLRYDWRNKETDQPTVVTNILAESPGRHPADLGAHRVPGHRGDVHVAAARARPPQDAQRRAAPGPSRHRRRRPAPAGKHAAGQTLNGAPGYRGIYAAACCAITVTGGSGSPTGRGRRGGTTWRAGRPSRPSRRCPSWRR